jgi:hypothetical protein
MVAANNMQLEDIEKALATKSRVSTDQFVVAKTPVRPRVIGVTLGYRFQVRREMNPPRSSEDLRSSVLIVLTTKSATR